MKKHNTIIVAAVTAVLCSFLTSLLVMKVLNRKVRLPSEFSAVDAEGKSRGSFKIWPDSTVYAILNDATGDESVRVCVEPGGSTYAWFMQGTNRASLGIGTGRAYLRLEDAGGSIMLSSHGIYVKNTNGHQNISFDELRNVRQRPNQALERTSQ